MSITATRTTLPLGLLGAAAFLSSAGARVIDPLLVVIADDFSSSIPVVSILITAFTLPYGLNQLVLGPIGDKYGKLRVMLGALVAYAAASVACAMATDLAMLTVFRACAGAASAGLIPVGLAYIADAVPYQDRQVVLSRFLFGVVVALTMAGPIGGVFGEFIGWRGVFLLLAASASGVAVLLALRIQDLPDRRSPHATFQAAAYRSLLSRPFPVLLLLGTLMDGITMAGALPFIAAYLHDGFALSYLGAGLVLAAFGLGAFVYTRWARRLLGRLGEAGLVTVGGCAMATALAVAMLSPGWWVFVPAEMVLGLGFFMFHTVLQARATELLPDSRATAVSSFAACLFLGQAIGAAAMGAMIGALGFRHAFLIDAGLIACLTVAMRLLISRRQQVDGGLESSVKRNRHGP